MRISLAAFSLDPTAYAEVAQAAEGAGFHTLWLSDHLVTPVAWNSRYPYSESGHPGYGPDAPLVDVLVAAGHIAALTSRLRIGTGVYILPLRRPLPVARAVATVQQLSGGRFAFGIGVGWMREEFHAAGEPFRGRGARADEMLEVMRKLWSGRPVEHSGEHYAFGAVQLSPPCPDVPVVVGGASEPALRRAALAGDGWYGPAWPLERSLAARDRIEEMRAAAGRTGPFEHAIRLEPPFDRDTVRRYEGAGVQDAVITLGALEPQRGLEADTVVALARRLGLG
jgi:probable F420-dependent oxidoreductase